MTILEWIRNYLHNQTSFEDRKLSTLEGWLERYYPYVYRQTMMIEYHSTEDDVPVYCLTFNQPIDIIRFKEIVSEQSWTDYTLKEIEGNDYITITNTQKMKQSPNRDPQEMIMGTFQDGQNALLINPIIDERGIHVSKSDDESLNALELYFKYR